MRSCRRRGLTCLELLLVLAIAALGLGVVLPALLSTGRGRADRTKCSGNARGMALAAIQYSDSLRFFPHVGPLNALQGGADTGDGPRVVRALVWTGLFDGPEGFVCPASNDAPRALSDLARREPKRWSWGGGDRGDPERSPLAGDGVDDPPLVAMDELSYGWTRRTLSGSGARSIYLLLADRACRAGAPVTGESLLPGQVGGHPDGVIVAQVDGTTQWVSADSPEAEELTRLGGLGPLGIEPIVASRTQVVVERSRVDAGRMGLALAPAITLALALEVFGRLRRHAEPPPATIYPPDLVERRPAV